MSIAQPVVQQNDSWFACENPRPFAAMRLFCLPYAGGSALLYRDWHQALPSLVEVCPIQLPGRMGRLAEPPYTRVAPLISALADALAPRLDKPYALFGHSMGALLCFELTRLLRRQGLPQPARLFLSARRAPHSTAAETPYFDVPDRSFLEQVSKLGGILPEILENRELVALLLPTLRADLELCQTYCFKEDKGLLPQPFTLLSGSKDSLVGATEMSGWTRHTSGQVRHHVIDGDHFFLTGSPHSLLAILTSELKDMLDVL